MIRTFLCDPNNKLKAKEALGQKNGFCQHSGSARAP